MDNPEEKQLVPPNKSPSSSCVSWAISLLKRGFSIHQVNFKTGIPLEILSKWASVGEYPGGVYDNSQVIGKFLEWMQNAGGYVICTRVLASPFPYLPTHDNIEEILARYFKTL